MSRFATSLLAVVLVASPSFSKTWNIAPDGSGDAPTIQAGIDSAAVGDTVLLADGTYTGPGNKNLDFGGKAIVVRSASLDAEACIIDVEAEPTPFGDPERGFRFHSGEGPESVLERVTITRGFSSLQYGGGILCEQSAPTIRGCRLIANVSNTGGGGIACLQAHPIVVDCRFEANDGYAGGGLYTEGGDSLVLLGCEFVGNGSAAGGGVLSVGVPLRAVDCRFFANEGGVIGGGVSLTGNEVRSPSSLRACVFEGNESHDGGAIYLLESAALRAEGCRFSENAVSIHGGAIHARDDARCTLDSCLIEGNTAGQNGGAIHARETVVCSLFQCTVVGNSSGEAGSAICCSGENARIVSDRSIYAFQDGPPPLECLLNGTILLGCADVYGNAGGDYVGNLAGLLGVDGNFSADPLFCDAAGGDFTLDAASPCLPGNHPDGYACGPIGAFGEGCDVFTAVAEGGSIPAREFRLFASPNPSAGEVSLRYAMPSAAPAPIVVYDIRGRVVRSLVVDGANGAVTWDGRTASGEKVAPGVYFVRIADGKMAETRRVTIVR